MLKRLFLIVASFAACIATPAAAVSPAVAAVVLTPVLKPTLRVITNGTAFSPLVAFTRASTGTDADCNGLISSFTSGTPRFGCGGYLSEEARTNIWLQSETLDNASNTKFQATITANSTTAPTGALTADTLVEAATNNNHIILQSLTPGAGTYALSFFAKEGTRRYVAAYQYQSGTVKGVLFDTRTCAFVSNSDGTNLVASYSAQAFSNGWCHFSIVAALTPIEFGIVLSDSASPSLTATKLPTYSGDGTSGMPIFGIDVEATSTNFPGPTSYIPTTTASVTRAADVASITGSNFSGFYNQAGGTLVTRITAPGDYNQIGHIFNVNDNSTSNYHIILKIDAAISAAGKRWVGASVTGGGAVASLPIGSNGAAGTSTLAYSFGTNNFAFSADNALIGTDTSGAIANMSQMDIGNFRGGSQCNCHILRGDYYKPGVTNAKLIRLPLLDLPRIPANNNDAERMAA